MSSTETYSKANKYHSKNSQLTLVELINILQAIAVKDPAAAKSALVFHIEFGGLTPSNSVEVTKDGVVIY